MAPRRWTKLSTDKLLDLRISELGLRLEGTALAARVDQLHGELEQVGFRFRPYVWLSTDWYAPDGLTGFAVPFYLAHPRLARLEHRQMLQVEGGTQKWSMKLLRHETAHALDNAYRLRRRKAWRQTFGKASLPYRQTYLPHTTSKSFVQHLDMWYAQSHPLEDFAETFAVWLQPRSQWRSRYRGWPALRKLSYVDELMAEIKDQPPRLRTRRRPDSVGTLHISLREYYRRKQRTYAKGHESAIDLQLRRLFSGDPGYRRRARAASFLTTEGRRLRHEVATYTGKHPYVVDQVLNEMISRCRELDLRLTRSARSTRLPAAILLTGLVIELLRGPRPSYVR